LNPLKTNVADKKKKKQQQNNTQIFANSQSEQKIK
jgi:hypothetical protein